MVPAILGGIGLFLLGMVLLADGLKAMAGDALRHILARFVGGRVSAMASGAVVTALVQSSSATTLMTIGFVSAGLLTFVQAVGVVFGANLGTTSTGWLVSLLGLKVNIGAIALPAVGIGALVRLLFRDRVAAGGMALAGFGLIFVGIDTLQGGMANLSERIDLSALEGATLGGRLILVLVGALMTVVMQSSSAAVATTLTALHTGAIELPQAGALVVGQNVGTTVTAALAMIGASVAARRTALAHILFNALTGVVAFAILPLFVHLADLAAGGADGPDAVALAVFHTAFNILGIAILAPWMGRFAGLVERMVPERGPHLTRRLDASVANLAPIAVEAARLTLMETLGELAGALRDVLSHGPSAASRIRLEACERALEESRGFLAKIRSEPETAGAHERHVGALHALDHLVRLQEAIAQSAPAAIARTSESVAPTRREAEALLSEVLAWTETPGAPPPPTDEHVERLSAARQHQREEVLRGTARGTLTAFGASRELEAIRWLDGIGFHLARAVLHLGVPNEGTSPIIASAKTSL